MCVEREGEKEREEKEKSFPKSIKKRIKNQAKINQKSTKKRPKIHQKINQKSVKNQFWRGPGGSLEALGGQYRKMNVPVGFSGPSWGRLGGLLGRLGGLLEPSWRSWRPLGPVLGSSWRPKSDPKSTKYRPKKSIRTLMPLGIDFLEDFGGFYFPKWSQDASKNLLKSMSISKGYFFKKPRFSTGKTMILVVLEAQLRTA